MGVAGPLPRKSHDILVTVLYTGHILCTGHIGHHILCTGHIGHHILCTGHHTVQRYVQTIYLHALGVSVCMFDVLLPITTPVRRSLHRTVVPL